MEPYISVDIGGSHITSSAVDPERRRILPGTISEVKIDSKGSAEGIIAGWVECLKNTITKAGGLEGIGLAMPGPFDYQNGVSLIKGVNKFDNLYGINVGQALKEKLELEPEIPVRFINDATAFAIGEAWAGKG